MFRRRRADRLEQTLDTTLFKPDPNRGQTANGTRDDKSDEIARRLKAIAAPYEAGHNPNPVLAFDKEAVAAPRHEPSANSGRPTIRANPVSTAFGDMVALLTKSPTHKHLLLTDLDWLLLPPVALSQFALADKKLSNGKTVLAGFVLWARVSSEVDARLSAGPQFPIRLQPGEWQSGDVFWVVEAVGSEETVANCIETLSKSVFRGKPFRTLRRERHTEAFPDGRLPS